MLSSSQTTVMNNLIVIHLHQSGLHFAHLCLYKAYTELFRWLWWLRQSPASSPKLHPPLVIYVVTQRSRPGHWPGWKVTRRKKVVLCSGSDDHTNYIGKMEKISEKQNWG